MEVRPAFSEDDRIAKVVGYLRENHTYEVFIPRERRIAGLTARDLLPVSDPLKEKLGNMVYTLPEITSGDTFGHAAELMFENRLSALPSPVKNGELRAVSVQTIMKTMLEKLEISGRASEIMSSNPVTIDANDAVLKAKSLMSKQSLDCIPVMKDGKLHGVLTCTDILFNLLPEERVPARSNLKIRFDYPVSKITQRSTLEVEPSTPILTVLTEMLKQRSPYALVKLWDEVQGMITPRDALKLLLPAENKKTPVYIVGLPDEPFEAEAAKMKFERLGNMLAKAIPSVKEIRAVVKSREVGPDKRRYEVSVEVYISGGVHAYVEQGYDLVEIFDAIGPRIKRILGAKQSRVTQTAGDSLRKGARTELE
jgi:CBS domain-containing protein